MGGGFVDKFIKDVALPRRITQLGDTVSYLLQGEKMDGARLGHDVFLNHEATHIVGAVNERKLANLHPLRHPAGLNVGDVVEI